MGDSLLMFVFIRVVKLHADMLVQYWLAAQADYNGIATTNEQQQQLKIGE